MSSYRAYICTLHAPDVRGVFWLRRMSELRALLEHFAAQWCTGAVCAHPAGSQLIVDRVWLTDGFLVERPTDFTSVPEQLANACPKAVLGAL